MGLLELFGRNDRDDVGTMAKEEHRRTVSLDGATVAKAVASGIAVMALEWGILASGFPFLLNIVGIVYFVVAYNVSFRPKMDNLGMLGGLVDHPFRYTDDINRNLLFLKILFLPGKFMVDSLRDCYVALRDRAAQGRS